ncbi:MAG: hypothetical protein V4689_12970 [Verrucomicrobiota bacterium]
MADFLYYANPNPSLFTFDSDGPRNEHDSFRLRGLGKEIGLGLDLVYGNDCWSASIPERTKAGIVESIHRYYGLLAINQDCIDVFASHTQPDHMMVNTIANHTAAYDKSLLKSHLSGYSKFYQKDFRRDGIVRGKCYSEGLYRGENHMADLLNCLIRAGDHTGLTTCLEIASRLGYRKDDFREGSKVDQAVMIALDELTRHAPGRWTNRVETDTLPTDNSTRIR